MSKLTPDELRDLRRLHIQAGRRVDALFAGDYKSVVRGQGMEFEELRLYQQGDEPRHVDWRRTARMGGRDLYVKQFREERQLTVILAVDVSGSTLLGSGGKDGRTDRRLQAARVAGSVAYASFRNRDRIGLYTFSDHTENYLPPRRSRGHVWSIIQTVFEHTGTSRGTDIHAAIKFLGATQKRHCAIILVSDFLDEGAWDRTLGGLSKKHTVHGVVLHDPADDNLPDMGLVEVLDAETGRTMVVDSSQWAGRLPVDDRVQRLRRAGVNAFALSTEDDAFAVLHSQFHRRRRIGR